MDDERLFFPEYPDEPAEALEVRPQSDLTVHGHFDYPDSFPLTYGLQQPRVSSHTHHLELPVQESELSLQQHMEAQINCRDADEFGHEIIDSKRKTQFFSLYSGDDSYPKQLDQSYTMRQCRL